MLLCTGGRAKARISPGSPFGAGKAGTGNASGPGRAAGSFGKQRGDYLSAFHQRRSNVTAAAAAPGATFPACQPGRGASPGCRGWRRERQVRRGRTGVTGDVTGRAQPGPALWPCLPSQQLRGDHRSHSNR